MQFFKIDTLHLNRKSIIRRLRVLDPHQVNTLVDLVVGVIKPNVAFRVCYVEEKGAEGVTIDEVRFRSRVLRDNLDGIGRVFPFVLTVGAAVDALIEKTGDVLEKYFLGEIANIALSETSRSFESHLCAQFALEKISCMTPGSLQDWPIEGQKNLFALLPDVETSVGVRLTDSLLMLPRKSVSGIYFPSEVSFFSCQLCPRRLCDDRRASYDEAKTRDYGTLKNEATLNVI
jgi:hypothetical protein